MSGLCKPNEEEPFTNNMTFHSEMFHLVSLQCEKHFYTVACHQQALWLTKQCSLLDCSQLHLPLGWMLYRSAHLPWGLLWSSCTHLELYKKGWSHQSLTVQAVWPPTLTKMPLTLMHPPPPLPHKHTPTPPHWHPIICSPIHGKQEISSPWSGLEIVTREDPMRLKICHQTVYFSCH